MIHRTSRFRALAVAVLAVVTLAGCSTPRPAATLGSGETVAPELVKFYSQQLDWTNCNGGFECATAKAPVDWAAPSGDTISLSLIRHRASGSNRVGSLFVNPGGPGASGVKFVRESLDYAVDATVQKSFDVIGFDPRGIGESTSVKCLDAPGMNEYIYGLPTAKRGTSANLDERMKAATEFAQACEKNTGALLAHVDSISTARDLDMMRALVGDASLNYLGYSYGTFIGAMYAQTFPAKVGRLVLDGAVDPEVSSADAMKAQAVGFEMALTNYLQWCFTQNDCPLAHNLDSARAKISSLLAEVDVAPIMNTDGRELGADTLVTAIIAPLYSKNSWKYLSKMFTDVMVNDSAEVAFALADWYNERKEDGTFASNQNEAYTAVSCLDGPASPQSGWAAEAAALKKSAPLIGPYLSYAEVSCSVWPHKAVITPGPLGATGDAPIVVIGTTGDPATPMAWAESLSAQLTNGKLIRLSGEGHTGYNRGSQCVNKVVDDYLVSGTIPGKLTSCS